MVSITVVQRYLRVQRLCFGLILLTGPNIFCKGSSLHISVAVLDILFPRHLSITTSSAIFLQYHLIVRETLSFVYFEAVPTSCIVGFSTMFSCVRQASIVVPAIISFYTEEQFISFNYCGGKAINSKRPASRASFFSPK